jgi:hypothetical protein
MMRNGVSEAGAQFDAFGFGHRAKDVEADSFGYVVEEQHPDMSTQRNGGHLRFILAHEQKGEIPSSKVEISDRYARNEGLFLLQV